MAVFVLDEKEKQKIRDMVLNDGESRAKAARVFGVSTRTIGRVLKEVTKAPTPTKQEPEHSVEVDYTFVGSGGQVMISKTTVTGPHIEDVEVRTESVTKDDPRFDDALGLLTEYVSSGDNALIAEAFELISVTEMVQKISKGRITADVESNTLSYKNEFGGTSNLSGRLLSRMMQAATSHDSSMVDGLLNFAERLIDNPCKVAVDRLYDFLEATDIEVTAEGKILCFKRVKDDFTDVRTGKFDNSPGKEVKMPRNEVDPDPDQTCSYGLHVCSKHYLSCYPGDKIIRVEVDPVDVVAIPKDYNNSKMRLCRYVVVDEVTDQF